VILFSWRRYEGQAIPASGIFIKTIKWRIFFVVYLISKLCWNIRTSTWMQTRVNSTRPSGKEAMSRINEDKLTFFGPPVITQIREDHLQRLKIEHQLKDKLPEKQCAYFHDSCSWRAYCKRNEIKSVPCKMKLCTLRNANIYFAKWKSALSLYPPSILQCFLSWRSRTTGRVLCQPQPKAF